MGKVLISGGSGLLGSRITDLLLEKGREVVHLSTRKTYSRSGVEVFQWNPKRQQIDEGAFHGVSSVVHLAGAGIADERWTDSRKKEIINSRVESSQLLINYINEGAHQINQFIGASAIGYYGNQQGLLREEDKSGSDFLAHVCQLWEDSYTITHEKVKKAVFRIGIVLAREGGALPEMTKTLPFFVGVLGSGKQIYSWIHLDDLARMFVHAIEQKEFSGTYNAVAPNPTSQLQLAKEIAELKNAITIPAPEFGLKIVLGEMSSVLFLSQNCSSEKIEQAGFVFEYKNSKSALKDLM